MNETLQSWQNNGWLRTHHPTPEEIANLMAIAERDLADACQRNLSADWKFGIAYNAALKLCTLLLHAEGYRAEHGLHHYRTLMALPVILGPDRNADAQFLETCRKKRNIVEYDLVGAVSELEAEELCHFVSQFLPEIRNWLTTKHPELLPG
jgi:hypothetical protein